jgi:uncharacterized repeat protein (TIGR03803 family)
MLSRLCLILCVILIFISLQSNAQELWGVTENGGASSTGAIFKYDVEANTITQTEMPARNASGATPMNSRLTLANDGNFYAMTRFGGSANKGVLFQFDPLTKLNHAIIDFANFNCSNPYGSLLHLDGVLYGMTSAGGLNNKGVIFKYNLASAVFSVLHNFSGANGSSPRGGLMQGSNGKLYGTTYTGGTYNVGVLFQYTEASNSYVYTSFTTTGSSTLSNMSNPQGDLMQASNGKLYGIATNRIFQYDLVSNSITGLYSTPTNDYDKAPLTEYNGKLYGVLDSKLFQFDLSNNSFIFRGTPSTKSTVSTITFANGRFYGTGLISTVEYGMRSLFYSYEPNANVWTTTNVGAIVNTNLAAEISLSEIHNNKFYCLQSQHYYNETGAVFIFNPEILAIEYTKYLDIPTDGSSPAGSLVKSNDKLLGLTSKGGLNSKGTLFEFDWISNQVRKIYDLNNYPTGVKLLRRSNGIIYGLTQFELFEYDPLMSTINVRAIFSDPTGTSPVCLIETAAGRLIGQTAEGGTFDRGTLFEFDPVNFSLTILAHFPETSGKSYGNIIELNNKIFGIRQYSKINESYQNFSIYQYDCATNHLQPAIRAKTDGFHEVESGAGLMVGDDGYLYYGTGNSILFFPYTDNSIYKFDPTALSFTEIVKDNSLPVKGSFTQLHSKMIYSPAGGITFSQILLFNTTALTMTEVIRFDGEVPSNSSLLLMNEKQAINFQLSKSTFIFGGLPFTLNATSDSGLPVSYQSSNPAVISIAGNVATIVGAGTATITAVQLGNDTFNSATPVGLDVVVNKAPQAIIFPPPPNDPLGSPKYCGMASFAMNGTSTGGSPLVYSFIDNSQGFFTGDVLTFTKAGSITIKVAAAGNSNYLPVESRFTFSVSSGTQAIDFPPIPQLFYDATPFKVNATASSGLPISFSSTSTQILTISGDMAVMKNLGTVYIAANQMGNACYSPATATQTVIINKAKPVITLSVPQNSFCTNNHPLITFTTTFDQTVQSNLAGVTIQGNSLTFAPGTYLGFKLTQAGDALHEPASSQVYDIYVKPAPQVSISTSSPQSQWGTFSPILLNSTGAADQYQWLFNDGNIANATSTSYTASQAGTYSLLGTNTLPTASCSVKSNELVLKLVTGSDISLFPNPANSSFTIQLSSPFSSSISIQVVSSSGTTKYTGSMTAGQLAKTISCGTWTAGTYVVNLTSTSKVIQKNVVVAH